MAGKCTTCREALGMIPKLKCFVENVDKGKITKPNWKSFSVVRKHILHELTSLKLKVFILVANLLHPIITTYKTGKPMLVKADALNLNNSSVQKLLHFDFKDVKNHCNITDMDFGYLAEKEVKALITLNVSQGDILEVRVSCRRLLMSLA
ncbi:hypothetical protein PR048_012200 [Dryococelus australis]|uniref:Uncharacterized protein n=1 Tax=Dryococelus australis TaxID=614101 RepID=A0ABQ9HNR7_9NEOP|nr:hypothetical protein PR048_012200 [Dryococelus australis]